MIYIWIFDDVNFDYLESLKIVFFTLFPMNICISSSTNIVNKLCTPH